MICNIDIIHIYYTAKRKQRAAILMCNEAISVCEIHIVSVIATIGQIYCIQSRLQQHHCERFAEQIVRSELIKTCSVSMSG